MNNRTICRIDDNRLIETVTAAASRLVFAAPGVSVPVAQALRTAWERLGPGAVSIILDVDPAVCRLGYGTLEGLEELQKSANRLGAMVCHQPGLRIGIVVSDQTTLVFTPTPLLIEPASSAPERPNAIILTGPPPKLADELGIGPDTQARQQIGLDRVPEQQVQALAADLKANPPLAFDLFRPVLVFNSQVEFVEFNLEKIQLQRQVVTIPPQLMDLVVKDIHGLFQLDVDEALLDHKAKLEGKKREIDKQFTRPMRGFGGSIIRRCDKEAFLKEIKKLELDLAAFRERVNQEFHGVALRNMERLADRLLEVAQRNETDAYRRFQGQPDAAASFRTWVLDQLAVPFKKVANVAEEMRVTYRFKGVTYECLKDREFIKLAQEAFPDLQLHEEYSAAREKPADPRQTRLFGR